MKVYAKFLNKTLKNEIQQHIKRIKDYTQLLSNISHWDARMVQCMQINVIHHTKKIKDKSHYHLKRCRKIIWWKSTTFYNKKSLQHSKWSKSDKRQILHDFTYMWKLTKLSSKKQNGLMVTKNWSIG